MILLDIPAHGVDVDHFRLGDRASCEGEQTPRQITRLPDAIDGGLEVNIRTARLRAVGVGVTFVTMLLAVLMFCQMRPTSFMISRAGMFGCSRTTLGRVCNQ